MSLLIGTYEAKIDAKGRVLVPASLKKQLGEQETSFVLKRSDFQFCLELFPMDEWSLVMQKINGLNRFVKENNDFIRKFMAGVKMIEIDSVGRMLIPKDLLTFSQIEKDVVFSATGNRVEIWDKQRYEQAVYSSPEDFSALAEKVMGGLRNE
ncbi:division/cell wall cluster transcriptional repressor MraZ [Capnocytophaga canimorsus]|uniref:division/cell wall cluster transcriptional repressor MraZ n=1 Tax=Capnocytophaga canimorsus TaxID=28188 RepID=UPI001ACB3E5E|nr:division/cell wall cluster transcriptional repressor MraZ [Capnocytophaga canimorsus]GIM57991.1 transcriptional regulator MraZ [Capnocytophaga canimorsus]